MISFAVCEDEDYFASKLETLLRQYAKEKNTGISVRRFTNGEALMQSKKPFDIILMDIMLSGEDGVTVMRRLREAGNGSQLLFITAYPEYALEAFSLDAVHYLIKPVEEANLFPALDRAVRRIASEKEKVFVLSRGNSLIRIRMKEILYCESLGHQIILHSLTGTLQFSGTLDAVQKQLDGRFFRCHRSYLVNMDYVTEADADTAFLKGGGKAMISRRRRQEFNHFLLESCRREPG